MIHYIVLNIIYICVLYVLELLSSLYVHYL
jgi:hypothetical protein